MATEVAGLKQIDYLLTSHFHIDHYGGAAELAQLMPIKNIVDKGIPEKLIEDRTFHLKIKSYKAIAANRITIKTGDELVLAIEPMSTEEKADVAAMPHEYASAMLGQQSPLALWELAPAKQGKVVALTPPRPLRDCRRQVAESARLRDRSISAAKAHRVRCETRTRQT